MSTPSRRGFVIAALAAAAAASWWFRFDVQASGPYGAAILHDRWMNTVYIAVSRDGGLVFVPVAGP
jgi:hypothetical protein